MAQRVSVRITRFSATIALALLAGACAKPRAKTPTADRVQRVAPDLSGARVMVFPIQGSGLGGGGVGSAAAGPLRAVPAALDEEIATALAKRGPGVHWVQARELDRLIARTPSLGIDPRSLAVASFRRAQVTMIGDPLYGDLSRLGSIFDARYALIPVTAAYVPQADGTGRIEIAAALIATFGADVLWYGIAAGDTGAANDSAVVASAARKLAQLIAPARKQ
jgi:hypothetical protein